MLGRLVMGVGVGMAFPAIRRIVILAEPERLGHNLGRLLAFDVGGFAAGPAVSAALVGPFGIPAPFLVIAAVTVAALPFVARVDVQESADPPTQRFAFDLLRIRPFAGAVALGSAVFLMIGAFDALWAVVLDDLDTNEWIANLGITLFALPLILLGSIGGRLAQRVGPFRVGTVGLLGGALFMALYGVVPTGGAMFAVAMVHAVNDGFTVSSTGVAVGMVVPAERQAGAQGVLGGFETLTAGITAAVTGVLYEHFGRTTAYGVAAAAMVVLVGVGALLARQSWNIKGAITPPPRRPRPPPSRGAISPGVSGSSTTPSASCVVIGAGIVGNCLAGHLARLGWTDLVLVDKGPLPNPGGSTGHASNFIFPTDHNKEMALLTLESQRQYVELGVNTTCGGIEVARDEARLEEFRRRMTSAKAWGIDARLLTPDEVKELVPFVNTDVLLGGFYTPSVSVVDSLQAGTLMRQEAIDKGVLTVLANTEVLDLEVADGAIRAVVTDKGRIEAEHVAIACGVWSPRIAAMAGATIPLTPAVHQMVDVGPIDVLQETNTEVAYPIVRDMDTFCYERQSSGSMEVGSYAHRPIFHHPDDIPSIEASALSPTELPFTPDDFDDQLEQAIDLMDMLGDAEIKYSINGLLSLTPDAMPVLGETVEVRNLWSAAAVWIKEGPGIARLVAEWMTDGYPHVCDPHSSDISRFYPHERTEHHIHARCAEHYNKTYGIVHPREQWASERGMRRSPFFPREEALGAVFFDARGWERPQWFESNADLLDRYPQAGRTAAARVGQPLVVADHQRRAPPPARARRDGRPHRVQRVRPHRAGRRRLPPADVRQQRRRAGRQVGVHAAAHARRRVPRRPHDHAPRRAALPRRHRRLRRRPRQALVQPPPARRRVGHVHRPDLGHLHDRRVGSERGGDDDADRDRPVDARGATCRRPASRTGPCATCWSTACRARCSASPTSARAAGRSTPTPSTGCGCGTRSGRPARRTTSGRSGSACTPSPGGSRRATG